MSFTDNSDNQTQTLYSLPDVYRSDINLTLSDVVFDRFFTKDNTKRIVGYVGTTNANFTNTQIQESSPHRQAFQLAPTMYTKVGTVETALSFKEFQSKLSMLGVDIDRMDRWANSTEFTWVPPINLDMLINYENYFWTSNTNKDNPQYLTIENVCKKSKYLVDAYDNIIKQRGAQYVVSDISFSTNTFTINGNVVSQFDLDNILYTSLENNINLDNMSWTIVTLSYDINTNTTNIQTNQIVYSNTTPPVYPTVGQWWYNTNLNKVSMWTSTTWVDVKPIDYLNTIVAAPAFFPIISVNFPTNSFSFVGKMDDVFTDGFVFFVRGSNTYLSDNYWTAMSSEYNPHTNITTTILKEKLSTTSPYAPTTPNTGDLWYNSKTTILYEWDGITWQIINHAISATISITDVLSTYRLNSNIACGNTNDEFDISEWDNNDPGSQPWDKQLLDKITHQTIQGWLVYNKLEPLALWYNPITDALYQYTDILYSDPTNPKYNPSWNLIISKFSKNIQQISDIQAFDNYNKNSQIYNQWSNGNTWIHKSSINSFNGIKRAQLPILEYDSRIELNEWVKIKRTWKYRASPSDNFEIVDVAPTKFELEPIKNYVASNINGSWYLFLYQNDPTIVVDSNYTNILTNNSMLNVTDNTNASQLYTVESSEYRLLESTDPIPLIELRMITVVKLKDQYFNSPLMSDGPTYVEIIPVITSIGDAWRGYHQHWCLTNEEVTTTPIASPKINILAELDNITIANADPSKFVVYDVSGNGGLASFQPQISKLTVGFQYQEFVTDILGVTKIDLFPTLTYNPDFPGAYSIPGSGDVRVYVNGIRQYSSYTEITKTSPIGYTKVDSSIKGPLYVTDIPITYVIGIEFNQGFIKLGDIVKICVGSASYEEMGLTCVPVRTIEDDSLFELSVYTNTQPTYMSLTSYKQVEQYKSETNQYPLFNVYDLITNDVVTASPIFSFKESSTSDINNNINKRIVQLSNGKDYIFQQHLTDMDNGILLSYRNRHTIKPNTFWYNPTLNSILNWDGITWSSMVTVISGESVLVRPIHISNTDPTQLWNIGSALWYNPTTNIIYSRDVYAHVWVLGGETIVSISDPSLQSIWQPSKTPSVPRYVDSSNNDVLVNSVGGDWEVINQWRNNPEHSNRSEISFTELYAHCESIISNQHKIPGLPLGGVYSYPQSQYNYGVGGTIKEYNDSFDTLISSMNVTNVNPVGLIEYAEQEFTSTMQSLFKLLSDNLSTIIPNSAKNNIFDFNSYIASSIITIYENNEINASIYGDSSAYEMVNQRGIKNWIASPPVLGLLESYKPNLSIDTDGTVHILHHDGHRSSIKYNVANVDLFARKLAKIKYPNTTLSMCNIDIDQPPTTLSAYATIYGNALLPGLCWYVIGNPTSFYRLEIYQSSNTPPLLIGNIIPNGTKYYNTMDNNTYVVNNGSWVVDSVGIGSLWKEVNLSELAGNIYLEVENRLYDIAKHNKVVFDYNKIIHDDRDITIYQQKQLDRFNNYISVNNIVTPFANYVFSQTDPWTWNYQYCVLTNAPTVPNVINIPQTSSWQSLYSFWYNTPYPHLEPWKIQGYVNKPDWWDVEYLDTTGYRRWKYNHQSKQGMWQNILIGVVPSGCAYPNGILSTGDTVADNQMMPTYNYVSVNIGDDVIQGEYAPDTLLPPYYDNSSLIASNDLTISSLISNYSNIISPDSDYTFGSIGPIEWEWIISSNYQYDKLIIAFLMQPAKWLHSSFGTEFTSVNGLDIDITQKQVLSHSRTLFHGDVYNTNMIYAARGLNQWYVNFNRYTNTDSNSKFRQQWVNWTPKLTYQFDNIIDSGSLAISASNVEILAQDFNTILTNTGTLKDVWLDAFNIKLVYVPPHNTSHNNEQLWKFDINVLNNVSRTIQYYGVKSYPFVVNTTNNVIAAYRFGVVNVDLGANILYVIGNQTAIFDSNPNIKVTNSDSSSQSCVVNNSVYDGSNNWTRLNIIDALSSSISKNSIIDLSSFVLPWTTGDMVIFSSSKVLPYPLVSDTPYFIIRDDTTGISEFKIAESYNDSMLGTSIDITTSGLGDIYVSEASSSFNVFGGSSLSTNAWYHLAIDKSIKKSITFPCTVVGIQNLINIIDGMSEVYVEDGFVFDSTDSHKFDPITGRLITWQLEVERFIDWAYGIQSFANQLNDRYTCIVNTSDNTMTINDVSPNWVGTKQVIFTSTGLLPSPLYPNIPYYILPTSNSSVYNISVSKNQYDIESIVQITTTGSGQLYVSQYSKSNKFATFELNPHRNVVTILTPTGLLSDVVKGPISDIKVNQTIFDQYGRSINSNNLFIYRNDGKSNINIASNLTNDVDSYYVNDPYNYIHIGGCHLFVEGYDHCVLLENYTTSNQLIYDPFLGVNISRLRLDFRVNKNNTKRPTLGGYYLHDNKFKRNIEGSAYDLSTCYDVFNSLEDSDMIQRSRDLLGYSGNLEFLNEININSKSQFMFYRGMIATKGSTSSILAYTNSKHLTQSNIDEFWAYKLTSFGDIRPKIYPEVKILPTDVIVDDIRFEFVGLSDSINSSEITSADKQGFINVLTTDESRWNVYPEQKANIDTSLFLDADVTNITIIFVNNYPPSPAISGNITYWYDNANQVLHSWNGLDWSTIVYNKVKHTSDYVYVKNDVSCDDVRVIRNEMQRNSLVIDIVSLSVDYDSINIRGDQLDTFYAGMKIDIVNSTNNVINYTILNTTYDYTVDQTILQLDKFQEEYILRGKIYVRVFDYNSYTTVYLSPRSTGQTAYYNINGECTRFVATAFSQMIYIYTVNPSKNRISPAKLVDIKSNTVVENIPIWHPAIGYHYHIAEHNINMQTDKDPAKYSNSPSIPNISKSAWNSQEVNKVWMDTSRLGYIPYSDALIYPLVGDRLAKWGTLADFGSVRVYKWTQSPVLPSQWSSLVTAQANDNTISQNNKATGTAKTSLFTTSRVLLNGIVDLVTSTITLTNGSVSELDPVIFSTLSTIPTGISTSTKYIVSTTGTNLTSISLTDLVGNAILFNQGNSLVSVVPTVVGSVKNNVTDYADVVHYVIQAEAGTVVNGDVIVFSTTGTLPGGLSANIEYTVTGVIVNNTNITFSVINPLVSPTASVVVVPYVLDTTATANLGSNVYYYAIGKGNLLVTKTKQSVLLAPAFDQTSLVKHPFIRVHLPVPLLIKGTAIKFPITNPTLTWSVAANDVIWYNGENVDIYVNGKYAFSSIVVIKNGTITVDVISGSYKFNESDIVDVVRSYSGVDLTFDPTLADDGTNTTWWVEDYEYTTTTITTPNNVNITSYYFWIERSTNKLPGDDKLSVASVADSILKNPSAYFIVQKPLDAVVVDSSSYGWDVPPYDNIQQLDTNGKPIVTKVNNYGWSPGINVVNNYNEMFTIAYREAIIRNVSQYVSGSDRYVIRFTRDLTLRDDIKSNALNMNLKNIHDEWILFRRGQNNNIPRQLWDKLTESLVGFRLNTNDSVPSADRVLYDNIYGTDTQYGLGIGQTFVNQQLGLATVLYYLNNPSSNFAPINIDDFMSRYSFNTPNHIKVAMDAIYNTFSSEHVNGIWFETLNDALSTKSNYKDLMKTSWISVNSTQLLDVNGKFIQQ